jgi:hypothetical protein
MYALKFRQHRSKTLYKVVYSSNYFGKPYCVHAPPIIVRSANLRNRRVADFPYHARCRTIRCYDETVTVVAPVRVLKWSDRPETPTISSSLFDDRKSVIDWASSGRAKNAGLLGSLDSALGSCRIVFPAWIFELSSWLITNSRPDNATAERTRPASAASGSEDPFQAAG